MEDFKQLNLHEKLMEGLDAMGFYKPTPVQVEAIPVILEGKDLIACAQTGTGKTAAYLLPTMEKFLKHPKSGIRCVVLVPTRELAIQIDQQIDGFGYYTGCSSMAVYGGGEASNWDQQKKSLVQGADIIVATPGRMLQHIHQEYVNFDEVELFILDEADRMLDMGFLEDITEINRKLPEKKQNLLFSATMPPKIRKMAIEILQDPKEINLAISKPAEGVVQAAFMVYEEQKPGLVKHLLTAKPLDSVIIFAGTKNGVDKVQRTLKSAGLNVGSIHSDYSQKEREEVLRKFKNREITTLIATDIMSRGIDVKNINLVVNYDVPGDAEDYIHRIGRTARADQKGVAFTLITEKDQEKFLRVEELMEMTVTKAKLPEHLGEAPVYNPRSSKNRGQGRNGPKKPFQRRKGRN